MQHSASDPQDFFPDRSIPLVRPPLFTPGLIAGIGGGSLVAFTAANMAIALRADGFPWSEAHGPLGFLAAAILVPGGMLLLRLLRRRTPISVLLITRDGITMPRGMHDGRRELVPFDRITSLHLSGQPPALRLLIESGGRVFQFTHGFFAQSDGPERTFREVRRRIANLPEGTELLEAMSAREELANEAMDRQPIITQGLIGLVAIFFLNQVLLGSFATPFAHLRWGANSAPLVFDGEIFRLFAANFLHGGELHFIVNGVALLSLGGVMERLLGPYRYLLTYLLAGLAATMASAMAGTLVAVGASGAIFGLLGGLAVINGVYRTRLPLGFRQPLRWWIFIIGINILLPILIPQIDVIAHAIGFVAGAATTWLLLKGDSTDDLGPEAPVSGTTRALAIGISGAFAISLGIAVAVAATTKDSDELDFVRRVGTDTNIDPRWRNAVLGYAQHLDGSGEDLAMLNKLVASETIEMTSLNQLAWTLALWPEANHDQLDLALRASTRMTREMPEVGSMRDTHATVLYRLGRYTEAARVQMSLLERDRSTPAMRMWDAVGGEGMRRVYASQLARFFAAGLRATSEASAEAEPSIPDGDTAKDSVAAAGAHPSGISITVRPNAAAPAGDAPNQEQDTGESKQGAPSIIVSLDPKVTGPATVYAVALRDDTTVGLFYLALGRDPMRRYAFESDSGIDLERNVRFEIASVSDHERAAPGKTDRKLWAMAPEIATYP